MHSLPPCITLHYMAATQPLSFRWDPAFIRRIDEARGLVPRSAFVRAVVEAALERIACGEDAYGQSDAEAAA